MNDEKTMGQVIQIDATARSTAVVRPDNDVLPDQLRLGCYDCMNNCGLITGAQAAAAPDFRTQCSLSCSSQQLVCKQRY